MPHPTLRLTMMFSATLSHRVMELAYEHMNNPELIRIEPDKMTVDRITQVLYFPSPEEKIPFLMGLLRRIDARTTMGFVNTKRGGGGSGGGGRSGGPNRSGGGRQGGGPPRRGPPSRPSHSGAPRPAAAAPS